METNPIEQADELLRELEDVLHGEEGIKVTKARQLLMDTSKSTQNQSIELAEKRQLQSDKKELVEANERLKSLVDVAYALSKRKSVTEDHLNHLRLFIEQEMKIIQKHKGK